MIVGVRVYIDVFGEIRVGMSDGGIHISVLEYLRRVLDICYFEHITVLLTVDRF